MTIHAVRVVLPLIDGYLKDTGATNPRPNYDYR